MDTRGVGVMVKVNVLQDEPVLKCTNNSSSEFISTSLSCYQLLLGHECRSKCPWLATAVIPRPKE